uniref:Rho GDP-dissociation inhibitor 1 n=1 Tax=Ursus americanus TaxID=9643 RepID=A0A452SW77_URSAM
MGQEPTAEQVAAENEEDEHSTAISPLPRRASRRSRGLDKDDRSLHKNKDALLGCVAVSIDKTNDLVGSYGPQVEEYKFLTLMEEAPKDMLAHGSYKSCFIGDKTDHLSWGWKLTIKKEWKD